MKKTLLKVLSFICVFMVVLQLAPMSVGARNINDVQKEIEAKKNELKALENKITANQNNKAAYEAAFEEYKVEYENLVLLIDEQELLINEKKEEVKGKTDQLSDNHERIQSNKEAYEQRLRAIYEMNTGNAMISALLTIEDPSDYAKAADALMRISQRDNELLDELATEKDLMEQQRLELQAALDELSATMDQLQENRIWCIDKMNEMKKNISDAEWQISQSQQESLATEAEIKELQAEYAKIFAQLQQQGSKTGDGSVRWAGPLLWPVPGYSRVSSWYGDPRSNTRAHYGIDIPAATGTDIVAAAPGTVLTNEWHYSYGWYIVIDHGDGLRTLYAHCYQQAYVPVGNWVNVGDTIAGVGNTGNSFGAHLHIEVHDNGSRQDPAGPNYLGIY